MKLRLRHNSIRLRLRKSEVERLRQDGECREMIVFPRCQSLEYVLERSADTAITASLTGTIIRIGIPARDLAVWCCSDQVGLSAEIPLGEAAILHVLVEKDFRCLDGGESEDQSDTFDNPLTKHLTCDRTPEENHF